MHAKLPQAALFLAHTDEGPDEGSDEGSDQATRQASSHKACHLAHAGLSWLK
jgi:hypothetical protein